MILLDAIYINKSGGKVLLDYLIQAVEEAEIPCFYLLDARLKGSYPNLPADRVQYMPAKFSKRFWFYYKNRNAYSKILCFGNIAPVLSCRGTVYTYFHQLLFLGLPSSIKGLARIKFRLKMFVFNLLKKNTDYFVVQSENVKTGLQQSYNFPADRILKHPFYPELPALGKTVDKIPYSFIYVSSGAAHKNHKLLFSAFAAFYKQHKKGLLTVTLPENYPELLVEIEDLQKQQIPINNIGFVAQQDLGAHYAAHQYLIYPSLSESFGLGIIESIQFGCKVLGADLAYTNQVCTPSLLFDPQRQESIQEAFRKALTEDLPPSVPLIENRIKDLIAILKP